MPSACVKMHNGAKSQRAKVILYTFLIFCSFARTPHTHTTHGYKMVSAVVAIRKEENEKRRKRILAGGMGCGKKKLLEGVGWQHFAGMTFGGKGWKTWHKDAHKLQAPCINGRILLQPGQPLILLLTKKCKNGETFKTRAG